mmetsp:Transcript_109786/g.321455  ORF Transcript_109786/g.321455 Transcript_109786/m.321455 type:complete len:229 (-) Transcript_109786:383-1069(-)
MVTVGRRMCSCMATAWRVTASERRYSLGFCAGAPIASASTIAASRSRRARSPQRAWSPIGSSQSSTPSPWRHPSVALTSAHWPISTSQPDTWRRWDAWSVTLFWISAIPIRPRSSRSARSSKSSFRTTGLQTTFPTPRWMRQPSRERSGARRGRRRSGTAPRRRRRRRPCLRRGAQPQRAATTGKAGSLVPTSRPRGPPAAQPRSRPGVAAGASRAGMPRRQMQTRRP